MSEQRLIKLDRPEAGDVLTKRKVYAVTLMYPFPTAPTGYVQRLKAYWDAVDQQISRLESRAGPVKRVFHEGISKAGQGGLDAVEQINTRTDLRENQPRTLFEFIAVGGEINHPPDVPGDRKE